jgi:hypothetical protein
VALKKWIQFRVSDEMKEQVLAAAEDCQLQEGEWMRAIIESALEAHAANLAADLAGEQEPEDDEDDEDEIPDPSDPDYENKVREAASGERERLRRRTPRGKGQPKVNPRDCVHPPSQRRGPKCGRCGLQIGRMLTMGRR